MIFSVCFSIFWCKSKRHAHYPRTEFFIHFSLFLRLPSPAPPERSTSRRKIKGHHDQGQQAREALRGKSASERFSERVSEREGFRGVQRFLEVLRGFQRFLGVFRGFSKALSETLSECHFPLRVVGRVAPNRVAP